MNAPWPWNKPCCTNNPKAFFEGHTKARAEAMTVCDTRATAGSVSEEDWAHIRNPVNRSWISLRTSVTAGL